MDRREGQGAEKENVIKRGSDKEKAAERQKRSFPSRKRPPRGRGGTSQWAGPPGWDQFCPARPRGIGAVNLWPGEVRANEA